MLIHSLVIEHNLGMSHTQVGCRLQHAELAGKYQSYNLVISVCVGVSQGRDDT